MTHRFEGRLSNIFREWARRISDPKDSIHNPEKMETAELIELYMHATVLATSSVGALEAIMEILDKRGITPQLRSLTADGEDVTDQAVKPHLEDF